MTQKHENHVAAYWAKWKTDVTTIGAVKTEHSRKEEDGEWGEDEED